MLKRLFQQVDPYLLDQYEDKSIVRRRRMPAQTAALLPKMRRALQSLPPRELQILYLTKAHGLVQDEARRMYSVHQSNISYRFNRALIRIQLHYKISETVSETQLRRKLFELGFNDNAATVVCSMVKTSSPIATAKVLGLSPGSVRYTFSSALSRLEKRYPESLELKLLRIIERNLNQLRCITGQKRWQWKKNRSGGGDFPNISEDTSPESLNGELEEACDEPREADDEIDFDDSSLELN
jgi:hypothetical protein